ncbi:MAG: 50S ribosomal protein L13 [Kiritimatiellia bacterium]|nr:50S ribosomal protein L13 [Kiritimatiellia bacterium]
MKTTVPKNPGTNRKWHVVDATDKPLGRLAVAIANILRGKNRPDFDPSVDMGDFVIVLNARKVGLSGKKEIQKKYETYSGYRGGHKYYSVERMRERHPETIISEAVWGMLPKNNIARKMMTRLRVFPGDQHTHAAQKPEPLSL